jgi:hypothetical protein
MDDIIDGDAPLFLTWNVAVNIARARAELRLRRQRVIVLPLDHPDRARLKRFAVTDA